METHFLLMLIDASRVLKEHSVMEIKVFYLRSDIGDLHLKIKSFIIVSINKIIVFKVGMETKFAMKDILVHYVKLVM